MRDMKKYSVLIKEFYKYCITFYELRNGIYPLTTKRGIIAACNEYLESMPLSDIEFDSFDREGVRLIIEKNLTQI